jgi:hypothetical protein
MCQIVFTHERVHNFEHRVNENLTLRQHGFLIYAYMFTHNTNVMLPSPVHCEDDDVPSRATYDRKASDPRNDTTPYEIRGRTLDNRSIHDMMAGRCSRKFSECLYAFEQLY